MLDRPIPKTAKLGIFGLIALLIFAAILLPMAGAANKSADAGTKEWMQNLVEDFFKHNYRDITARKSLEWGEPIQDENGNTSIRYKYEATIWDKDKIITDQLFVFDKDGKLLSFDKISPFPLGSKQWLQERVEEFFKNNYRDITARKSLEWGEPVRDANENVSIRYKYEATIWNKDKILENKTFTFDKEGKFIYAKNVEGFPREIDKAASENLQSKSSKQNGVFKATMPNGVTVDLVGICEHPSKGKQWWRPDGTALAERPYDRPSINENLDNIERGFEVALRVIGFGEEAFHLKWRVPEAGESSSIIPERYGRPDKDMRTVVLDVPESLQSVDFGVGIASGPWKTIGSNPANTKGMDVQGGDAGGVIWSQAFEKEGLSVISVAHSYSTLDIRIVAVGKDGTVHKPQRPRGASVAGIGNVEGRFEVGLSDIKEFRFQTREFEWVEFKNVSLRHGVKTDVQVEIEGASKVSDKDKMASENLAAEGTSGRELDKIVEQAVMTISTCAETDPRVEQSLESLQGLDEQAVVKELVKFLDSDKNTIRRSAIYILWKGNIESIEPAVPHLQNLCSHEEEYTRGMAALALGARKVEPGFDTLCNMTLNDSSAYARRCAAYALGLMGNPEAKDVLGKALKDSDFNVRNNAEAALTMLSQVEKPK